MRKRIKFFAFGSHGGELDSSDAKIVDESEVTPEFINFVRNHVLADGDRYEILITDID